MRVFIDESGVFTGSGISLVAALVIPEGMMRAVENRYRRIRPSLPMEKGEVKGRLLNEADVDRVVRMLMRSEALLEISAVHTGIHTVVDLEMHKAAQIRGFTVNLTEEHHSSVWEELRSLGNRLERMPLQLYVQSVLTFEVIARTIEHATMFFSQRRPRELGAFHWCIDAKDRQGTTEWEKWWSFVVMPKLHMRSLREPMGVYVDGDYSHFRRFERGIDPYFDQFAHPKSRGDRVGVDLKSVMTESFRFSSDPLPGLELVDILASATRRAFTGRLGKAGWQNVPKLMIHRKKQQYVQFCGLAPIQRPHRIDPAVIKCFSTGGRSMLASGVRDRHEPRAA